MSNKIYVAVINHKYGSNIYAAATEAGMKAQVADFCREQWDDRVAVSCGTPADHGTGDAADNAVIELYFDWQRDHGTGEDWMGESVELVPDPDIFISWNIDDIRTRRPDLNLEQLRAVAAKLADGYDAGIGMMNWDSIDEEAATMFGDDPFEDDDEREEYAAYCEEQRAINHEPISLADWRAHYES